MIHDTESDLEARYKFFLKKHWLLDTPPTEDQEQTIMMFLLAVRNLDFLPQASDICHGVCNLFLNRGFITDFRR